MKKKAISALLLSLLALLSFTNPVFAAKSTTATVPVTLTVSNEYRAVNVTVPASLPVYVINGSVVVADNAKITNNSRTGAVQVTGLSIMDGAFRVGDYDNFSGSKTIALKINGCPTRGSGNVSINSSSFPVIEAQGSMPLKYYAKVSGDVQNAENIPAANIVFTISIVN